MKDLGLCNGGFASAEDRAVAEARLLVMRKIVCHIEGVHGPNPEHLRRIQAFEEVLISCEAMTVPPLPHVKLLDLADAPPWVGSLMLVAAAVSTNPEHCQGVPWVVGRGLPVGRLLSLVAPRSCTPAQVLATWAGALGSYRLSSWRSTRAGGRPVGLVYDGDS